MAPEILDVKANSVMVQFIPSTPTADNAPSHYLLQFRHEDSNDWTNVLEIDADTTGNVTWNSVTDFETDVRYFIRIVPVLNYEDENHVGAGESNYFIVPAALTNTGSK